MKLTFKDVKATLTMGDGTTYLMVGDTTWVRDEPIETRKTARTLEEAFGFGAVLHVEPDAAPPFSELRAWLVTAAIVLSIGALVVVLR